MCSCLILISAQWDHKCKLKLYQAMGTERKVNALSEKIYKRSAAMFLTFTYVLSSFTLRFLMFVPVNTRVNMETQLKYGCCKHSIVLPRTIFSILYLQPGTPKMTSVGRQLENLMFEPSGSQNSPVTNGNTHSPKTPGISKYCVGMACRGKECYCYKFVM